MSEQTPQCPFVYADGHQCTGRVSGLRFYGNLRRGPEGVRKVRFWCSEKSDHAGAVSSWASKERMEFYPDRIPVALRDFTWGSFSQH